MQIASSFKKPQVLTNRLPKKKVQAHNYSKTKSIAVTKEE